MKTIKTLSAKKVLCMALSLAILLGSLFVANVGVTFNAKAESTENYSEWTGAKTQPEETDAEGNIIINTADEFAWVALQGGTATQDINYKVADNSVFNMMGMEGITLNSTASDVQSATKNTNRNWVNSDNYFMGNLDGNGVIIYNVYGHGAGSYAYSGLFPISKQTADGDGITFKNIKICASYFTGYHNVGAVIGLINAPGTSCTATFENLYAENCYLSDNGNTNPACQRTVANIIGAVGHTKATMVNCFAKNNSLSAANIVGGLIGNTSMYAGVGSISNSIVIGTSAIPVEILTTDSHPLQSPMSGITYSNVYTDQTVSKTGIATLSLEQMTGDEALNNMSLDFGSTWFANISGVPELRVFHSIVAGNNGDGTHSELCADCDIVGIISKHIYNIIDYTNDTSSCICGVSEHGTNDVWDGTKATDFASGTGSENDPYIIKTAEQLLLMVRSTGLDDEGNPLYYEVADSVNALYINDTRSFDNQAAFVAAVGGLKNWSGDVVEESYCSCGKTHVMGYPYSFSGNFNGNGVTIYGLYSSLTPTSSCAYDSRLPGVGFFTGLTGNATIKNIVFDMSYIANTKSRYVGVLTSSFGFAENNDTTTKGVHTEQRYSNNANVKVKNIAVRNVHFVSGDGSTGGAGTNTFAGGIIAAAAQPKSIAISNCLFDGTNATYATTPASGTAYKAGIYATGYYDEPKYSIDNCLSVGAPAVITEVEVGTLSRTMGVFNCYTTESDPLYDTISVVDGYTTVNDLPTLNWTAWDINAVKTYGTPMPKVSADWNVESYVLNTGVYLSYNKQMATTAENVYTGFDWGELRNNRGVYDKFNELIGSGTAEDPYIINDAKTLYLVIASGGTHFDMPQHFKLGCNIDLGGMQWVDTELFRNEGADVTFYEYHPFEGVLDGDGHTIYNLYTADDDVAGFIPQLDGGTVKNLHFRNASVASDIYAGVIVGEMLYDNGTPVVEECSVEGAAVYSPESQDEFYIVGYQDDPISPECGTIKNSYFIGENGTAYFTDHNTQGVQQLSAEEIKAEILAGNTEYTSKWYVGGAEGSMPRFIDNAVSQPCADIDGDGLGEEYRTSDSTALKNKLLRKADYKYVYGDVNGSGSTDMRDLAALYRAFDKYDETVALDGFWANVKAENIKIYYTDSDNYDFARRLELYLENVTGADIVKTNGSASNFAINIVTGGNVNDWSYTYDLETAVTTITGGCFTAVEEAVDHFIVNTSLVGLPVNANGTLGSDKYAVSVNGSDYYYAWGDEFNSDVNSTVSYDKWGLRTKGIDKTPDTVDSDHEGIRAATNEEAIGINNVSDGKLTLKRGFTGASSGYKYYMSGIWTLDSMLFKQGYLEMKAIVPADGCAFPAWWLLTNNNKGKNNDTMDDSLYGKVYELNEKFDGVTRVPTPTNVQSYKYKLPTQTLEFDLFEVIQRPTFNWIGSIAKSEDYNVKYNIHKWYTYSLEKNDSALTVYDLDWANAPASGAFPTTLLTATGETTGTGDSKVTTYTKTSSSLKINESNLESGDVNGAITYEGLVNDTTNGTGNSIEKDMKNYCSNGQITERKYGFLWTESTMSFMLEIDGSMQTIFTLNKNQMDFGDENYYTNDDYGFGQYAYMLIENHIFTSSKSSTYGRKVLSGISDCDFVIDYVRLYQLDGARDIVTAETERENVQSR